MTAQEIISAIGLVGFGSLLTALVNFSLKNRERKHEANQALKEVRYKAIILLMYCYLEFEKETKFIIQRPDIKTKQDLFNELKGEWVNMTLYASKSVILTSKLFLKETNYKTFARVSLAMRTDLYGLKGKLDSSLLLFDDPQESR